jgi:hypothetical protein
MFVREIYLAVPNVERLFVPKRLIHALEGLRNLAQVLKRDIALTAKFAEHPKPSDISERVCAIVRAALIWFPEIRFEEACAGPIPKLVDR